MNVQICSDIIPNRLRLYAIEVVITDVKTIVSLIAKLRIYILGTVRMSLLHVIMIIRMTFAIVPNIERNKNGIDKIIKMLSRCFYVFLRLDVCQVLPYIQHYYSYYPVRTAFHLTPSKLQHLHSV